MSDSGKHIKQIEWLGALAGLLGSALLASNTGYSGYGFLAFLVSNLCWFWIGIKTRMLGMVVMQIGFTATSLVGVWRWLFVGGVR